VNKQMDAGIRHLVQTIHDCPGRVVLVTAGAGTQALAWLLSVAGASRTLLEALIPYDESSFNDFLGRVPEQYVAAETAGMLAGRAIARAQELHKGPEPVIGLACSATIITDRPKRGQHRAHVVAWTAERILHDSITLHKGSRLRAGEEEIVSRLILDMLARTYCLDQRLELPLADGDIYTSEEFDLVEAVAQLQQGEIDYFAVQSDGRPGDNGPEVAALLSGAFNPLHEGHLALAQAASELLGRPVTFELAAVNAGKPQLEPREILLRLLQFAGRYDVLISNAPLFSSKARLFPGAVFVVGYDTAERVLQPRYYGKSKQQMVGALSEIRDRGCRFLVAGRTDDEGTFRDATELVVPTGFRELFEAIPASRFRRDVSSSQLRRRSSDAQK
jgi:hypothetical protein